MLYGWLLTVCVVLGACAGTPALDGGADATMAPDPLYSQACTDMVEATLANAQWNTPQARLQSLCAGVVTPGAHVYACTGVLASGVPMTWYGDDADTAVVEHESLHVRHWCAYGSTDSAHRDPQFRVIDARR